LVGGNQGYLGKGDMLIVPDAAKLVKARGQTMPLAKNQSGHRARMVSQAYLKEQSWR
jgi:hypothetical protein